MPNPNSITILPGELFTAPYDMYISEIHVDGAIGNFTARFIGNTEGLQKDTAKLGVFSPGDSSCIGTMPTKNFGSWDTVYNHVSGANLRCVLESQRITPRNRR